MSDFEKEKREAIEAGERAIQSLNSALESLNSAKNWGILDMFGGGFISTLVKHSKLDSAKDDMERAKIDLKSFSKELEDVNMAFNLDIEIGEFLTFADWFFDGFLVDWMVQDKINTAKENVQGAINHVEDIIGKLKEI